LALVVEGKSNAEIAQELGVSLSTARFHVSIIIDKLGAANRTQAATLALRHGLVP
jgi:DNA-binding NarL/FixJ family response regulator